MDRLTVTDEQLEALRVKHGRIAKVNSPAGDLVFRAPTAAEESGFQAALFGSTLHPGAAWKNLMVTTAVFPDQATFQQVMQAWPGMNLNKTVTNAIKVLRGEVNDDEAK